MRATANSLIDWSQLDRAEQRGNVLFVLRGPDLYDPALAPLLRRFAAACCRAVQAHLMEQVSRDALGVIERFAYGQASFAELVEARDAAKLAARRVRKRCPKDHHARAASEAVRDAGRNHAFEAVCLTSWAAKRAGLSIRRQAELFERLYEAWLRGAGCSA
ncbi:MAG TPA: hypothetical protein VJ739_16925 [Gemmataceae bacterium]|nr:hypothetical protein [Gemmataceae bacterium]